MAPKNSSRAPQQGANTLASMTPGNFPQGISPRPNLVKPTSAPPAQQEQPPAWATGLMTSIESLNQRIGLIESGAQRQAFNKAATTKVEGGVPLPPPATGNNPVVQPVVPVAAPIVMPGNSQSQPMAKAPMGESGSGYTRLPNGKLVRNKRPQPKPLQVRQAKNWRSSATTSLVNWLKTNGVGPEDPKPVENSQYQNLVINLAMAKDYQSYVKSNEAPLVVHEWRNAYQGIYTFESVNSDGNWADEVDASEASEIASQSNSGIVVNELTGGNGQTATLGHGPSEDINPLQKISEGALRSPEPRTN